MKSGCAAPSLDLFHLKWSSLYGQLMLAGIFNVDHQVDQPLGRWKDFLQEQNTPSLFITKPLQTQVLNITPSNKQRSLLKLFSALTHKRDDFKGSLSKLHLSTNIPFAHCTRAAATVKKLRIKTSDFSL